MSKAFFLIVSILLISKFSKADEYDKVLCSEGVNVGYICSDGTFGFYRKVILIGKQGNRCYLSLEMGPIVQDEYAQTFHSDGVAFAQNQESVPVSMGFYPIGYEQTEFSGMSIEGFEQKTGFRRAELKIDEVKQCASLQEAGSEKKIH